MRGQAVALSERRDVKESQSVEGHGAAAANGSGAGALPRTPSVPLRGSGAMAGSGQLARRTLSGPSWVRGSGPAVLNRLRDAAVVRPAFLTAAEEETLSRELEPDLRRRRYEYDHWDAVRRAMLEAWPRRGVGGGDGGVELWDGMAPRLGAGPWGWGRSPEALESLGPGRTLWRQEQGRNWRQDLKLRGV